MFATSPSTPTYLLSAAPRLILNTLAIITLRFSAQVIGIRGGAQPKKVSTHKNYHVAATITAPAEGPMMEILWTFGGKTNPKDMCEGTSNSRWNKTANGVARR